MKWLAAAGLLILSVAVIRAQLQPPGPHVIRAASERPAEDSAVARGRVLYDSYGCVMCHGADGKGGFANPNAETDSKVPAVIYVKEGYTPAEVAAVIRNGKSWIGRGDPQRPAPPYRMPGWHDRMSPRDVDDLVQYLMSLYPTTAAEKWR